LHDGIEGAHCVMHTHTTAGVAVACLQGGLQQTNFYSAQLHNMVAYHDFEGITIHADEGPRVLKSIGHKPAVILRNHGLLAWATRCHRLLRFCGPCNAPAKFRWPPSAWELRFPCPKPLPSVARAMPCSSTRTMGPVAMCSRPWCAKSTDWTLLTVSEAVIMKICVVGAGAIGGWMGVLLARLPGVQLSVLARGETLKALHAHGLRMSDAQGDHTVQVIASDKAADLGAQDLIVLAVKAPALEQVVPQIAPMMTPTTQVLTAMNGVPWWFLQGFGGPWANRALSSVDPQGRLAQAIPAQQIIGCVVHSSCAMRSPGHVQHHFGNGLIVGEPSGVNSAATQRVYQWLQEAGFQATLSPCIPRHLVQVVGQHDHEPRECHHRGDLRLGAGRPAGA